MTDLNVPDSVKSIRETLCVAQTVIGQHFRLGAPGHISLLQRLIDDCDRQRPLGQDGKHGTGIRCTPTCGCEVPVATAPLPTWDQMTDRDKHEALWHVWKRESEGAEYAVENYPAMYRDHPALVDLDEEESCDHAKDVVATVEAALDRMGPDEYARLIDLDPDVED